NACSTPLYAALRELNTPERALATIEDPVEQVIPGADQVGVDPVTGLTYESGLHAILLSDPDVVLVGELADAETAVGAVRAAVSGRLVLSRRRLRGVRRHGLRRPSRDLRGAVRVRRDSQPAREWRDERRDRACGGGGGHAGVQGRGRAAGPGGNHHGLGAPARPHRRYGR